MHAATEVIGMMASLTSFLIWLPQGVRVFRYRNDPARLQSIVLSTQVISLAGSALWGTYAVLIDSFWLGAPSLVNGPIAIATLVVCRRAHRPVAPAAGTTAPAPAPVPLLRTATGSLRVVGVRELVAA
jgi:uncharacterized protein with PQ loop repeat